MIYLDNNATTPVDPEVSDVVLSSLKRDTGNPSSGHLPGRKAREVIESARQHVADLLGCSSEEVFFTSGGTESNNLALIGTAMLHRSGHIITSSIEHPSILNTCSHLASLGFEITQVPVDRDGMVAPDDIRQAVRKDTVLVTVMHANNETGILQPVEDIGDIAEKHGVPFHIDAAQSIGKIPYSLPGAGVDMMTVVSHKFYGPKGIGALFVRRGSKIRPILFGGGHEKGLRPGTENVSGIAGLGKACQLAKRDMKQRISHTTRLRDRLLDLLSSGIPDLALNGHRTKRLPNTLNIRVPGIMGSDLVDCLRDTVALSTGSACHEGIHKPSAVLRNMGLSEEEALSSARLSAGKDNTEDEITKAAQLIVDAVLELQKRKADAKKS